MLKKNIQRDLIELLYYNVNITEIPLNAKSSPSLNLFKRKCNNFQNKIVKFWWKSDKIIKYAIVKFRGNL